MLVDYCRQEGKPCRTLVYRWRRADPSFRERLAEAQDEGLDFMAQEVISIADGEDFRPFADAKTRIDARIRMLGRWSHRFSEKRQVEQTGSSTIQIVTGVPDPKGQDLLE